MLHMPMDDPQFVSPFPRPPSHYELFVRPDALEPPEIPGEFTVFGIKIDRRAEEIYSRDEALKTIDQAKEKSLELQQRFASFLGSLDEEASNALKETITSLQALINLLKRKLVLFDLADIYQRDLEKKREMIKRLKSIRKERFVE